MKNAPNKILYKINKLTSIIQNRREGRFGRRKSLRPPRFDTGRRAGEIATSM